MTGDKKAKAGELALLEQGHLGQMNPDGRPVVGWLPNSQGIGGLHNPRGFGLLRVVVQKMINDTMRPLYDQPMIVENAGSIVIVQLGNRVVLAQNFRMIGERLLLDAGSGYVKRLQSDKLWGKLAASLGRWSWEAPRGLAPSREESENLEAFILRTAKLEAMEEVGLEIANATIVGRVNVNTTFFAHSQYVVHAEVASMGAASPETLEIIGQNRLFTMEELRALNAAGEFEDGLTLAALALCGLSL